MPVSREWNRAEEEEEPTSKGDPDEERAARLREQFKIAEDKLNDTVEQERTVQEQLDELEMRKDKRDRDDDDDEDLFGGDDDDDDDAVSFRAFLPDVTLVFVADYSCTKSLLR